MIRIGICDDEKVYRDLMAEYLREFFGEENIEYTVFEKGEEVMQYRQVLDFLFLDIEMEGLDGIQIKNILEERFVSAKIVFMTSHDERMPEAFGTNVVDFIVKPLEKERVQNSFRRLQKFFHSENICVMVDGREVSLPANDILYIEAEDKYTYVYTARDKYLVRGPLSEWEKKLPKPQFCRCSRFFPKRNYNR